MVERSRLEQRLKTYFSTGSLLLTRLIVLITLVLGLHFLFIRDRLIDTGIGLLMVTVGSYLLIHNYKSYRKEKA